MLGYSLILFDLDGTLTDPKGGITRSVQFALSRLEIDEPDLERLTGFIGPPLGEMFAKTYNLGREDTRRAIGYYREFFMEQGIFDNEAYPGIEELLNSLKKTKRTLVVATSKPTVFAERILEHFRLKSYFDLVVGSHLDQTRETKADIIAYIMEKYPQVTKRNMVMIGDREHDVIGAQCMGIDSIAVRYGYGCDAEWEKTKPDYLVGTVQELQELLLG